MGSDILSGSTSLQATYLEFQFLDQPVFVLLACFPVPVQWAPSAWTAAPANLRHQVLRNSSQGSPSESQSLSDRLMIPLAFRITDCFTIVVPIIVPHARLTHKLPGSLDYDYVSFIFYYQGVPLLSEHIREYKCPRLSITNNRGTDLDSVLCVFTLKNLLFI